MIHREGDVVLAAIFRYDLVEATQLVSVHALGFRFCTVLCPKLVPLVPLTLLLQDLLAVRLQITQVYAFPGAVKKICNLLIAEVFRNSVYASPH